MYTKIMCGKMTWVFLGGGFVLTEKVDNFAYYILK